MLLCPPPPGAPAAVGQGSPGGWRAQQHLRLYTEGSSLFYFTTLPCSNTHFPCSNMQDSHNIPCTDHICAPIHPRLIMVPPSQYPLPPPPGTYILQAQVRSAPFIQDCCAHMSGERGAVPGECRPLGLLSAGSAASGLNTYIYSACRRRGQNNCLFCLELRVYSTCSMLGVK